MKIRIKDNSVRFRLTKSEVKKLCTELYIESKTVFNSTTLTYCIQVGTVSEDTELSADFVANKVTLIFPSNAASTWYESDRITYQNDMTLHDGTPLRLLLEKDFVCLDHSNEDQSDNYENPNKTC